MLRGKSSLFALLVACLVAAAWSGVGMAEEITHQNVGTMAANAKTAQDYEALANYYEARAKMHKEEAEDAKAQYDAIHKPMGKRTGSGPGSDRDARDFHEGGRRALSPDGKAQ